MHSLHSLRSSPKMNRIHLQLCATCEGKRGVFETEICDSWNCCRGIWAQGSSLDDDDDDDTCDADVTRATQSDKGVTEVSDESAEGSSNSSGRSDESTKEGSEEREDEDDDPWALRCTGCHGLTDKQVCSSCLRSGEFLPTLPHLAHAPLGPPLATSSARPKKRARVACQALREGSSDLR